MCVNVKTKWGGSRVTADGRGSRNRSQKIPVGESFYNREEWFMLCVWEANTHIELHTVLLNERWPKAVALEEQKSWNLGVSLKQTKKISISINILRKKHIYINIYIYLWHIAPQCFPSNTFRFSSTHLLSFFVSTSCTMVCYVTASEHFERTSCYGNTLSYGRASGLDPDVATAERQTQQTEGK